MDELTDFKLNELAEAWIATRFHPVTWESIERSAKLLDEARQILKTEAAYQTFVEEILSVGHRYHVAILAAARNRSHLEKQKVTPLQALIGIAGGNR